MTLQAGRATTGVRDLVPMLGSRGRRRFMAGPLFHVALAAFVTALAADGRAAEPTPGGNAEAPIRAAADAFVAAFDKNDAEGVAALWVENGTLAGEAGEVLKGREAIAGLYSQFFKAYPGATMQVDVKSIHFVTPEIAVEDGTARVAMGHAASPAATRYHAVHVLQDGRWLMASVSESRADVPSGTSGLKQLGWLVGAWESEAEGTTVRASFEWLPGEAFLKRTTAVTQDGMPASQGLQIIGWDPQAGAPRSWSFDATGGYGGGPWTATPGGWVIESHGVLASGEETASRELLIRVPGEPGLLGWRSVNRSVGKQPLTDLPEVVFERVERKP